MKLPDADAVVRGNVAAHIARMVEADTLRLEADAHQAILSTAPWMLGRLFIADQNGVKAMACYVENPRQAMVALAVESVGSS